MVYARPGSRCMKTPALTCGPLKLPPADIPAQCQAGRITQVAVAARVTRNRINDDLIRGWFGTLVGIREVYVMVMMPGTTSAG